MNIKNNNQQTTTTTNLEDFAQPFIAFQSFLWSYQEEYFDNSGTRTKQLLQDDLANESRTTRQKDGFPVVKPRHRLVLRRVGEVEIHRFMTHPDACVCLFATLPETFGSRLVAFSLRFWPRIKQFLSNCPASDWTFSFQTAGFC